MMIDEQTLDPQFLTGCPSGEGNLTHRRCAKNAFSFDAGAAR